MLDAIDTSPAAFAASLLVLVVEVIRRRAKTGPRLELVEDSSAEGDGFSTRSTSERTGSLSRMEGE